MGEDGGGLFWGILADETEFENGSPFAYGGVYFDADASVNTIVVTPEPSSLLLLGGLAIIGLRRRE